MGLQTRKVVELFDSTGEPRIYALFSGRLPEFMEAYPATDGWKVERDVVSAASLAPELVALHAAAVGAGKRPVDLGLPPIPRGHVFRCRLLNGNGEVVRTASTLAHIRDMDVPGAGMRDWERAETNAFQRLIAALGFGGDLLDKDEEPAQDVRPSPAPANTTAEVVAVVDDEAPDTDEPDSGDGAARSSASNEERGDKAKAAANSPIILKALQQQVEKMAKKAGVKPLPRHGTAEECKEALRALTKGR